jgi:hypothetical protein
MAKRVFTIEWPDDNGPMWMNQDSLLSCLTQVCCNTRFTVQDVTGDKHLDAATAGPAVHWRWNRLPDTSAWPAVAGMKCFVERFVDGHWQLWSLMRDETAAGHYVAWKNTHA